MFTKTIFRFDEYLRLSGYSLNCGLISLDDIKKQAMSVKPVKLGSPYYTLMNACALHEEFEKFCKENVW